MKLRKDLIFWYFKNFGLDKLTGINYQLIAIMVGMGLIGTAFFGPIPFAVADENDDSKKSLKEKLEKLKEAIRKHRDQDNDKCSDRFKFMPVGTTTELCDREKPEIKINEPDWFDRLQEGMILFEIEAKDNLSGIDEVEVKINRNGNQGATNVSGDMWELQVELESGRYVAIAKATDNVGNSKRDIVVFRVI